MMLRRTVLAGIAALPIAGTAGAQSVGARAALDSAAAAADPAEALRLLQGVRGATATERLDLEVAREGLAIDDLMRRARLKPEGLYALQLKRTVGEVELAPARARIEAEHVRLQAEADRLFRRVGLRSGSVGERYSRLWRDERFLYADDAAGRDRAVADMNRAMDAVRPRLAAWFGALPPECANVAVRRMSPEDEARGRGGYRELPTPAGPGAYYVDLKEILRRPGWTLPSVALHELLPGHAVHLPIESRANPHPLRLRYAGPFSEGWAIYAETLPTLSDPREELGRIHWLLFRANRARADLGIHLDGWTVDQARARLVQSQGEPAYFAPFETDLPRIAREPASRTAEAIVWLTLADLARGKRGAALRRFHRAVLADGRKRLGGLRRAAA